MTTKKADTPLFAYGLRTVTEAAALAAYEWIGRGDKESGDGAAVEAMRDALNRLPVKGTVVIGEGEKDEAPALYNGEEVGAAGGSAPAFDIAVDPVEGTSFLAKGLTNAMGVIAMAPEGTMMKPGPAFYMEKFAGPPAVRGKIDPQMSVKDKLNRLAECLNKPVSEITVFVLEKPRHKALVEEIQNAGARVSLYPGGDVAGAIMGAIPGHSVDCLMGTGGTPEGIISAAAIRSVGGEFMGRLDPQLSEERERVEAAGLSTETWYRIEDVVSSSNVFFCATGITPGLLFEGVERSKEYDRTQTMIVAGSSGERQVLTTYHPR